MANIKFKVIGDDIDTKNLKSNPEMTIEVLIRLQNKKGLMAGKQKQLGIGDKGLAVKKFRDKLAKQFDKKKAKEKEKLNVNELTPELKNNIDPKELEQVNNMQEEGPTL